MSDGFLSKLEKRVARLENALREVREALDYSLQHVPMSPPDMVLWGANMAAFHAVTEALRQLENDDDK